MLEANERGEYAAANRAEGKSINYQQNNVFSSGEKIDHSQQDAKDGQVQKKQDVTSQDDKKTQIGINKRDTPSPEEVLRIAKLDEKDPKWREKITRSGLHKYDEFGNRAYYDDLGVRLTEDQIKRKKIKKSSKEANLVGCQLLI